MSSDEQEKKPVATAEEWAAMNSINKHFTFRERTAFLVGWRLALRNQQIDVHDALEQIKAAESPEAQAVVAAAKAWMNEPSVFGALRGVLEMHRCKTPCSAERLAAAVAALADAEGE